MSKLKEFISRRWRTIGYIIVIAALIYVNAVVIDLANKIQENQVTSCDRGNELRGTLRGIVDGQVQVILKEGATENHPIVLELKEAIVDLRDVECGKVVK